MKHVLAFVFACSLALGCATMKPEAAGTFKLDCNVPEAAVLVDDAVVASAGELHAKGKLLPPGFYRVELRHPGYYSYFTEINVPESGVAAVKAELHPLLD